MSLQRVAIASDHGGYDLKAFIKEAFEGQYEFVDMGTDTKESCNYADFGHKVAAGVASGEIEKGIIICGTGIGISMAANRHKGVRAGLCTNATMARLTRQHNDANILALGARITGVEVAKECVETFLNTDYEGGRHQKRIDTLDIK